MKSLFLMRNIFRMTVIWVCLFCGSLFLLLSFCFLWPLYYFTFIDLLLLIDDVWYWTPRHFQQYFNYIMSTSFSGGRSRSTRTRPTDHVQATGKLYHLRLQVEFTLFCNLQSRARAHTVLVIGLYERVVR